MLDGLRQRAYPPEFRIRPAAAPAEATSALERIAASLESLAGRPADDSEREVSRLLAQLATDLWRLRPKLASLEGACSPRELRALLRPYQSAWDAMIQAGIEIDDHVDEPYDGGMAVEVLTFQPSPGLARQRIIETLRPTVFRNGRLIQRGQVIVGQPAREPQ